MWGKTRVWPFCFILLQKATTDFFSLITNLFSLKERTVAKKNVIFKLISEENRYYLRKNCIFAQDLITNIKEILMSDFLKPLSSRSPKWWLIVVILVIDGLVAQISATTCTSVASIIAIAALLLLLSLFVYCLYFKIFLNGKE